MVILSVLLLACTSTVDAPRPDDDAETGTQDTDDSGDTGDTADPDDSGDTDTAVDPDEDADGFSPDEGDCDDGDARVYPGAPDACDTLDQDCDGEPVPAGSCGELVPLESGAVGWWHGDYQSAELSLREADTDYTGDGVVDVLAYTACIEFRGAPSCHLNVALLRGAVPDGSVPLPAAMAALWVGDPWRDYILDFGHAGDFDGDGSADVFVTGFGSKWEPGSLYVIPGPADRWSPEGAYLADAAAGWWQQAAYDDGFGIDAAGGNDVDGDGLDDLMVWARGAESEDGWNQAQLSVVLGRTGMLPYGALITDEPWFDEAQAQTMALLPDMDGDGIGEAAVNVSSIDARSILGFLPIDTLRSGGGGVPLRTAVEAVQFGEITSFRLFEGVSELGDVEGDGFTDIALFASRDITGDGAADYCATTLRGATDLRTGDPDDRLGGIACFENLKGGWAGTDTLGGDSDGDGVPDVVFSDTGMLGGSYAGCIVPSSRVPTSGTVLMEEVRPYCFGSETEPSSWGATADLDLDGYPEILGTEASWDNGPDRYVGRILVAPGFEIPWDEASRW